MKKINLIIILFSLSLLCVGCNTSSYPVNSDDFIKDLINDENVSKDIEISLFENIEIYDVTFKRDSSGWIRGMGKIKNNNNVAIDGYFDMVLYDKEGNIIDITTIPLPLGGIDANQIGVFSDYITEDEFHSYEFYDSVVVKR